MPIMGPPHRTQLPERPFKLDSELSRWKWSGPCLAPANNLEGRPISTTQQVTGLQKVYGKRYGWSVVVFSAWSLEGDPDPPTQDQEDREGMCRAGEGVAIFWTGSDSPKIEWNCVLMWPTNHPPHGPFKCMWFVSPLWLSLSYSNDAVNYSGEKTVVCLTEEEKMCYYLKALCISTTCKMQFDKIFSSVVGKWDDGNKDLLTPRTSF